MDYVEILNHYFEQKKEFHPKYSLRSFAKDIGMPSSNLSNVLKGKQGLSKDTAIRITERLNFDKREKEHFIYLVLAQSGRSKKERETAKLRLQELFPERYHEGKVKVDDSVFQFISNWYYYVILEMFHLTECNGRSSWFAKKIGLPIDVVSDALKKLSELGLVKQKRGIFYTTGVELDTPADVPSVFVKTHYLQTLKKASEALNLQSVEEREFSSLTVAIDNSDIDFIKAEIRRFKFDLDRKLSARYKKKKPNSVYCLAIQFFNLLNERETI